MGVTPEGFFSTQPDAEGWVVVRCRTGLDEAQASAVLAGIAKVDWEAPYHAYGPATCPPCWLW